MSRQVTRICNSIVAAALKAFGGFFFLLAAITAFEPEYRLAATGPLMAVGSLLFALPYTGLFERFMAADTFDGEDSQGQEADEESTG
ncbi:hypothetical protein LTR12_005515 [Friedmanniomyces endolithicus]|nr:hypothetical protein LTR74_005945 [Friedmanniomyces endolithicus]KAK1820074.1 hypothetical protein LTR12_005515 [Friedmanniomyces endolithicus]